MLRSLTDLEFITLLSDAYANTSMQGGIVMPLRVGRYLSIYICGHGVTSGKATAIRPNTVCELLATKT